VSTWALAVCLAGCGADGPYAMIISHLVTDDPSSPFGYECSDVSHDGSTGSGSPQDDFWTQHTIDSHGVEIVAGSGKKTLERRTFGVEFLRAHKMARFVIEAPSGARWSYMVWGGDRCEPCPSQPYEPLPGDISECGDASDTGPTDAGAGGARGEAGSGG
jgi:hypothetical protein